VSGASRRRLATRSAQATGSAVVERGSATLSFTDTEAFCDLAVAFIVLALP